MGLAGLKPEDRYDRSSEDSVDGYVSLRVRERRILLRLTQQQLADQIGITCPQVHKYETGVNRIPASRLFEIAQALGVEVGYFFEGMHGQLSPAPTVQQHMLLELARHFISMSRKHQEEVSALTRSLAYPAPLLVDGSPLPALERMLPVVLETPLLVP